MKTRTFLILVTTFLFLVACGGTEPPVDPTAIPPAPTDETAEQPTAEAAATNTPLPPPSVATAVPTDEAPPAATEAPVEPTAVPETVADSGLPFTVPPEIAAGVTITDHEALPSEGGMAMLSAHSAYTEYVLDEYPVGNQFHVPRMAMYAAPEFAALVPQMAGTEIELMQEILATQPDLATQDLLPSLPVIPAANMFRVQEAYVDFANGRGVRYITQYAQAPMPVANDRMVYVFQGLSDDGRTYVSARLPISAAELPPMTFEELNAKSGEELMSYVADMEALLQSLSPDAFTPSLTALDGMMASITADAPTSAEAVDGSQTAITLPPDGAQLMPGETAVVEGVSPSAGPISVTMTAGLRFLAETTAVPNADGRWTADLTIPSNFTGRVQINASADGQTDSVVPRIAYSPVTDANPIGLEILRPVAMVPSDTAVAGAPLFFEGRVDNPVNDQVTFGVMWKDCTEFVAQQTINITGGPWTGYVIVPETVSGDGCVAVWTGGPGEEDWFEVQQQVQLLSPEDPAAPRIQVGNANNLRVASGETITLFGSAVGVEEVAMKITVRFEDNEPTVVTETTVPVNQLDYWESSVTLPADQTGSAFVEITAPENEALSTNYFFTVE